MNHLPLRIDRTRFCSQLAILTLAITTALSITGCATAAPKQISAFSNWPAGKSPTEVGHKVATNMLPRWIVTKPYVHYAEDSTWVHSLQFATATKDGDLKEALVRRFDRFQEPGGTNLISWQRHVDHTIFGIVPLELYLQTKGKPYLELGKMLADRQWEQPTPEGLSGETRFWIDDMYMITILQVQAFRATGDQVYLDRATLEMVAYLDKLQRTNGLFYHGPDFPFFWGRGNGWVAAGMTELLRFLPENHPKRARIMQSYHQMMAALLANQDTDGMWHQLIDGPDSYKESSCTAMFTYAMITGVKHGWLPEKPYAETARKGWLALTEYIDADGNVDQVCIGTGQRNEREFYLNRPRRKGDHHGQAPTMWCVMALLRSE
jgi:unsaturated rhamnogalacturonyl hydrolase